ncbi:HGxxPAAW family protein [Spirillospora sp. NPDC052269]
MSDEYGSHAGRPSSWLAVTVIFAGFTVGGVALCLGPQWVLFWVGAAIIVIGFVLSALVHLFADVVVDAPRVLPEVVDYSVFGSRTTKRRGGLAGEKKAVMSDSKQGAHG